MNAYGKTLLITAIAVAASALVTARSAEPEPAVVLLPSPVVTSLLQYLSTRPYLETAGLIGNMQRCIQDQVPDSKGVTTARGSCPEISDAMTRLNSPVAAQK